MGLDHFTTIVWLRLLQQLSRQEIWRPRRHFNTRMMLTETLGFRRLGWADRLSLHQDLGKLTHSKEGNLAGGGGGYRAASLWVTV